MVSYRCFIAPARRAVPQRAPNFKDFRCNKVFISFINHVDKESMM